MELDFVMGTLLIYLCTINHLAHAVLYKHSSTDTTSELQGLMLPSQLPSLPVIQYPDLRCCCTTRAFYELLHVCN